MKTERLERKENINIKLPKLTIPKFYGNAADFLSFWNSFSNAIHENENLNDIEKFCYLKSFLGGTAYDTIDGFDLTSENYETAIELLKQRYDINSLIDAHVDELLKTKPLNNSNDVKNFRKFYNHVQKHIRCLESLKMNPQSFGTILTPLLIKNLPTDLILEYNKTEKNSSYDLKGLLNYLSEQLIAREKTFSNKSPQKDISQEKKIETVRDTKSARCSSLADNNNTSAFLSNVNLKDENKQVIYDCIFCSSKNKHPSRNCAFAESSLTIDERKKICKEKGACFRCLGLFHLSSQCKSKVKCEICKMRHVKIMCFSKDKIDSKNKSEPKQSLTEDNALTNNSFCESVMLQTLIVNVSEKGKNYLIRAIIDTGSSRSYVSKFIAKRLKLKCLGQESVLHGLFGGLEKRVNHGKYIVHLSNIEKTQKFEIKVMDQETICASVPKLNNDKYLRKLTDYGIQLSDIMVEENRCLYDKNCNEIHVLIGADYAGQLFTGKIKHLNKSLVAMETHLGWTVLGGVGEKGSPNEILLSLHVADIKLNDLWSLDSLGITEPALSQTKQEIEKATEQHFIQSLKKDHDGRYQVSLPWLQVHPELPDNRKIAEKRLRSCINSLQTQNSLDKYENVFKEWIEEEIIEPIDVAEIETKKCHYLPHRAIFREHSTTPIRPIFDASAKEKNSVSLNDCIEKGPNYIELIPRILNRFRIGMYGVISDIRRAFLQISINPTDRDFLRFLWWEGGNSSKLVIYRNRRVVFGVNVSPFLLCATIKYHLENVPEPQREIALKLKEAMYVDNCVASVDSIEELNTFIIESTKIMATAKFDLRGWKHNKPINENSILNLSNENFQEIESVLGLKWNLCNDTLSCDIKEDSNHILSKRTILSVLSKIFDPIGFTSPVTLVPKLILQECWKQKINWDASLPKDLEKRFLKWASQLKYLKEIEIPRRIPKIDENTTLHIFCDASKNAYATCIFLRHSNGDKVNCQLLQSRARVAPIKPITIPRLEILACTIGARLAHTVKEDLKLYKIPFVFWTDSTNALFWIKQTENWATFIANRVNEIRRLSNPDDWRHIPGKFNIADLPSRGCGAQELKRSEWWKGPKWIYLPQEQWPAAKEEPPDFEVINTERRKIVATSNNINLNRTNIFHGISKYEKILRILSWIYRFVKNAKVRPPERIRGGITSEEMKKSEIILFRLIQEESFEGLQDKKIRALHPVLDSNGLMKIKTRIFQRNDAEEFLFPILLPSDHSVVLKLISSEHERLNHAGLQFVMCSLRERFWIIKSRKTIRKVIKACVKCQRFDSAVFEIPQAPLPEDRVREALIFEIVGIDLTGPLILKGGQKTWIVLFTCANYRAIHLELVLSLSTDSFLQAFRRFIARRGRPATVYSDNGTNFVGADNLFKSIDWNTILDYATVKRIVWKFIPPSSPWWGGWWERLIGVLKRILRKVLGKSSLNYDELLTIICECENIMNNRPLTYMSEDIDDLKTITPAMFLKEIPEIGIPDFEHLDSQSMKKRYLYRLKIMQDLRKRFRKEYLGQLQQNSKFLKEPSLVKIGDLVLVPNNDKRQNWPLARILETFPSKDGHIRLVKLKTAQGTLLRPLKILIPLELTNSPDLDHQLKSRFGRVIKPPK